VKDVVVLVVVFVLDGPRIRQLDVPVGRTSFFSDKQPRGEAGVAQQRQPGQSHSSPNIIPYRPGKNTFGTVDQGAFAAKSVSA